MSVPQRRYAGALDELERLVGIRCKVTRTCSTSDGLEAAAITELDARLLHCPAVGAPLWLLVDGVAWLRTSPIADIRLDDGPGTVVLILTQNANYRLAFARATAASFSAVRKRVSDVRALDKAREIAGRQGWSEIEESLLRVPDPSPEE